MLGGTIRWVGHVGRYCEVGGGCQVYNKVDMSTVCIMYYRRWVWEVRYEWVGHGGHYEWVWHVRSV